MKFQRQNIASFRPRQHLASKKKLPGPRMTRIFKEVQRSQAYMTLNVPPRNSSANRVDDVENIGYAPNGKTYDSLKLAWANKGQDIVVAIKRNKYPLGLNLAMANGNTGPRGKSKQLVVSPSSMDLEKSMPNNHGNNSSDTNRIAKKPLNSSNILFRKRKVVASSRIQGNDGCKVHFGNEHPLEQINPSSRSKPSIGMQVLRGNSHVHRRIETTHMSNSMMRNGGPPIDDCRTDNDKFKGKRKGTLEKMLGNNANGIEETKIVRPGKRKYICPIDEDDISGDDQNLTYRDDPKISGVEDGLTSQPTIVEQFGSLPIDEPIWSGLLKIGNEGHISSQAHLLAKSCEKVWECSRSLQKMVQVTKLSRLETEPKCFRVSSPTEDNIGLYFFPQGMSPNEDFDKLVKEVVDNDLILRAIVGEAEMLIFPSILLPERHQTFQGKHYLWGLFKRREDKVHVEGEKHMRGTAHEKDNGKASRRRVGQKGVDKERMTAILARSNGSTRPAERAAAEGATPAPAATAATSHAPSSTRQDERAAAEAATPATAVTSHASSSTCPAERAVVEAATVAPAAAAATSQSPSSAVPHGGMYGFIGQPTARMQQLIEEMVREGAVVFAMRGETLGFGLGRQ
ncbi:unnamed protein product [Alopecurus aequalis]